MAPQEEAEVVCLLIGRTSYDPSRTWDDKSSGPYIGQYALVLETNTTGVYNRVGMSEHDSRKGWFKNAEAMMVNVL